jgi:hypothetical protein
MFQDASNALFVARVDARFRRPWHRNRYDNIMLVKKSSEIASIRSELFAQTAQPENGSIESVLHLYVPEALSPPALPIRLSYRTYRSRPQAKLLKLSEACRADRPQRSIHLDRGALEDTKVDWPAISFLNAARA